MSNYAPYTTAAAVTAGLFGSAYCAYHIFQNSKPRIPTEWTQVGTLQNIYTYPIKSCGPVVLETGECSTLGLKDGWLRDRVLMVIDEKDNFLTARAYPEMLLVSPRVRSSVLTLTHKHDKEIPPVHVNLAEVIALQKPMEAKVWGVPVPVFDCGKEVSEWFTKLLNRPPSTFRLVYYATQQPRTLRGNTNKIYKFTKNDTGALPDETPFNIVNEASVEDLNSRLRLPDRVSHRSFRPNFVLRGAQAYAEDYWKFLKIGDVVFEIIKPCTRCVLTTIGRSRDGRAECEHRAVGNFKELPANRGPRRASLGGQLPAHGAATSAALRVRTLGQARRPGLRRLNFAYDIVTPYRYPTPQSY